MANEALASAASGASLVVATARMDSKFAARKRSPPVISTCTGADTTTRSNTSAGGTALTAESQVRLIETRDEALRRSGAELVVIGHTDTVGSQSSNDALSLRRAQQVRNLYIQSGFPAARIEAVGRGERELAVPTPDETDEPRNRRVEILLR